MGTGARDKNHPRRESVKTTPKSRGTVPAKVLGYSHWLDWRHWTLRWPTCQPEAVPRGLEPATKTTQAAPRDCGAPSPHAPTARTRPKSSPTNPQHQQPARLSRRPKGTGPATKPPTPRTRQNHPQIAGTARRGTQPNKRRSSGDPYHEQDTRSRNSRPYASDHQIDRPRRVAPIRAYIQPRQHYRFLQRRSP